MKDWPRLYAAIARDFGYDRDADAAAARTLSALLPRPASWQDVRRRLEGRHAHVLGAGPRLRGLPLRDLPRPLLAADGACGALLEAGTVPDLVVTDLDGDVAAEAAFAAEGALALVAAHGDNEPALDRWTARFPEGSALGTTQVPDGPDIPGVVRVPGFTDGDRAACLAEAAGAASVTLHAFDFETPGPGSRDPATKKRKLAWARKVVEAIEIPVKVA